MLVSTLIINVLYNRETKSTEIYEIAIPEVTTLEVRKF